MSLMFRGLLPTLSLLMLAAVVAGCAVPRTAVEPTPGEVPAEFPGHSLEDIEAQIRSATDTLRSFSGRGQLTINSPDQRGTYSATLRGRRSDSLFLSVGQFGFEGLRALVTPDSFYVYDVLRNRVSYGSVDEAGSALPLPVGGDDTFRSLLGIIVPSSDVNWRLNASGRYYTLAVPEHGQTLVVDPSTWRVIRYEERDEEGQLVEERLYSDFQETGGVLLARRVSFNLPQQETSVTMSFRELALNPPSLDFSLRAGRTAERTPVGTR